MADRSPPPGFVTTSDGVSIELAWSPASPARAAAVVTHPHPLMGGDMHNPVPAGLARGLSAAGVTVVRLGFRGVGGSSGEHGGGGPERADVVASIDALAEATDEIPLIGVGYSFGADVLLAVEDVRLAGLVAVAPPLRILPVDVLAGPRDGRPTLILSPAHDQFCDPEQAAATTAGWPSTTVEPVVGTDHFLAGGVQRVVDRVLAFADEF